MPSIHIQNDPHLKKRVDERRERRGLRHDQHGAEKDDHNEQRQEPEFLPDSKKSPKIAQKAHASSKLIGHAGIAAGERAGARSPVGLCVAVEGSSERVFLRKTEDESRGREYKIKQQRGEDGVHDLAEQPSAS